MRAGRPRRLGRRTERIVDVECRAAAAEQRDGQVQQDPGDSETARNRDPAASGQAPARPLVDDIATAYAFPPHEMLMPALRCIPNVDDMTTDAQRKRRLAIFGGVVLVAIIAVAVAVAVSSGGTSDKTTSTTSAASTSGGAKASGLKGVGDIKSEFAGIPQKGNVLGSAGAPATLMVFADLQCPFCGEFENTALPAIVQKYVRPGKLKVVFQPIVILGNDSILGARASAAAAQQNKMFDFNGVLYRNQGQENTGYLNNDYVKKIAGGVAGLNAAKLASDLKSPPVNKLLNDAQQVATAGHVDSTPTFFVAKKGATLAQLPVTSLDAQAFYPTLDKLTG